MGLNLHPSQMACSTSTCSRRFIYIMIAISEGNCSVATNKKVTPVFPIR